MNATRCLGVAVVAVLLSVSALVAGAPSGKIPPGQALLWPAGQMKWEPFAPIPGAKQARLWGDPDAAEHGLLYQWPAGSGAPLHWHTHGDHGVVVSGTLSFGTEGKPEVDLGPGSFFSFAGGVKHSTRCKPGADCVFFVHREGKFDATMVEAAKK